MRVIGGAYEGGGRWLGSKLFGMSTDAARSGHTKPICMNDPRHGFDMESRKWTR